jgi:hypothetical protein
MQTAPLLNNYRRLCWQICRQIQRQFGGSVGSRRQLRRQIGGSVIHRQLRRQDPYRQLRGQDPSVTSVAPSALLADPSANSAAIRWLRRELRWRRRQISRQLWRQFGGSVGSFVGRSVGNFVGNSVVPKTALKMAAGWA